MCNCFFLICCILVLTKEIRRIVNEPKTFCERYGLRLFCRVYRIGDRQQFCSAAFLDLSVLVWDQSGENRTFDNAQFRNTASCGRGFRRFCRSDRLPCVHCDCTCDGGCRDRYDGGAGPTFVGTLAGVFGEDLRPAFICAVIFPILMILALVLYKKSAVSK